MGLIKKARSADYWSTDPVMATPFFNKSIPQDRFELLLRSWHFCSNNLASEGDQLFQLRDICNALFQCF